MSRSEILNLIGVLALFAFSLLLAWVARHAHRFGRYGREALGCAACWIFVVGLMRVLSISDVVGTDTVRYVNTLFAIVFLVILGEVILLRRVERQNGERRLKGSA